MNKPAKEVKIRAEIAATEMSSPSFLFRSISHRFAGSSKYLISKPATSFKSFSTLFHRQMSTAAAQSESPPWLMLPPSFEGGAMIHNFYSLTENKVITLTGSREKELSHVMSKPYHYRVLTGSSHGYLALFSRRTLDLFLYNPISRRHIKLPPIQNLPNSPKNVAKVILSCSPDEDYENCRAVMMYNCTHMLAVCCPGRSKEWTPFGRYPDGYDEIVYSSEYQLLFGLTNYDDRLETWDLRGPSSPRMIMSTPLYGDGYSELPHKKGPNYFFMPVEDRPCYFRLPVEHLVVADHYLLLVTRFIIESVAPDGSYVDCYDEDSKNCPHMTIDFDVHKFDPEKGIFTHVDSLGELALFIGLESDTVALPAGRFSGLKANSIYFTDTIGTGYWAVLNHRCDYAAPFGGHDNGIFNYEDKTISSCYYPCDVQSVQRILPSPMWFFPSSQI
ncbi:hypothetical protein CASFOL_033094 [Castilleja foliolosa]|uniref:KIB1-4 beta-propeller domain-containing protein n=1 Tax=Castilleja foliolosa TaxID=1961234 RepID=A0ABD3C3C0_9LAMI